MDFTICTHASTTQQSDSFVWAFSIFEGRETPRGLVHFGASRDDRAPPIVQQLTPVIQKITPVIEALRVLSDMEQNGVEDLHLHIRTASRTIASFIDSDYQDLRERGFNRHDGKPMANAHIWIALDQLMEGLRDHGWVIHAEHVEDADRNANDLKVEALAHSSWA